MMKFLIKKIISIIINNSKFFIKSKLRYSIFIIYLFSSLNNGLCKSEIKNKSLFLPSKNENWYSYWSIGISRAKNGSYIDQVFNKFGIDATNSSGISVDWLGFYWPVLKYKAIIGVVVNSNYNAYNLSNSSFKYTDYLLSFSSMFFLGQNIGSGFFFRGDLGISYEIWEYRPFNQGNFLGDDNTGFGFLLGTGYALPISQETRLLFNFNWSYRKTSGTAGSTIATTLGILI